MRLSDETSFPLKMGARLGRTLRRRKGLRQFRDKYEMTFLSKIERFRCWKGEGEYLDWSMAVHGR